VKESFGVHFFLAKLFSQCNNIFCHRHSRFPDTDGHKNKKLEEKKGLDFNRFELVLFVHNC
jgi:hypothetical protein